MMVQSGIFDDDTGKILAHLRQNFNISMKLKFNIDDMFQLKYGNKSTCEKVMGKIDFPCPDYIPYNEEQKMLNNNNN